jgi:carbamoyl-phosphate synthase large subunit
MNILLINPGRRDYLVKYFINLSKKYKLRIYLLDKDKNIPSFAVSNKTFNFISPPVKNKSKYTLFLKKFILKKKINVIFPLSEWELKVLAQLKYYFKKKSVEIIVSSTKVINICQNKLSTAKFLDKNKILYPKIVKFDQIKKFLPVIKKKTIGSGSRDQVIIKYKKYIPFYDSKSFFFQKYLNYQEYGADILNDLNGNYIHSSFKKKLLMRAGDTDRAEIIKKKIFEIFAKKISLKLRHIGLIDIDFLFNGKQIFILDINPRIGGGYPFTHEYGYNYLDVILSIIKSGNKNFKFNIKNQKIFSKGINIYSHK